MFCTNCGTSNKVEATFCVHCTESLSDVQIEGRLSRLSGFKEVSVLKKLDFLKALFDLSFGQSVVPKIMGYLYGLSMLSATLIAFFLVLLGFHASMWLGMFTLLIGAPLIFLITVIYSRILLETILSIFRLADHLADMDVAHLGVIDTKEKPPSSDSIQWNV